MMMTQEQAFLKSRQQLQAIEAYVKTASSQEERIDQVKRELFSQLLLLGRSLLEGFVAAQGDGDAGLTLEQDSRTLHRSAKPHARRYLSIFGELSISRWVYAERGGAEDRGSAVGCPTEPARRRFLLCAGRLAAATVREGIVS